MVTQTQSTSKHFEKTVCERYILYTYLSEREGGRKGGREGERESQKSEHGIDSGTASWYTSILD